MTNNIDHDRLFKELIATFFVEFISLFFPQLMNYLYTSSIAGEAWQKERNQTASKVTWRFTTEEARVKLKHLYPVFEEEESSETNTPN